MIEIIEDWSASNSSQNPFGDPPNSDCNSTILIESTTEFTLDGSDIPLGTWVGVFYIDSSGNYQYGGGTEITGQVTSIAAWGSEAGLNNGFQPGDEYVFGIVITANGTNGAFVRLLADDGTTVGSIDHSGSNARYLTSSDYRLKENIVDMTDATTRIKQLKPRRFNFIADETNTTVDGFLAHEVSHDADGNPLVPEAVNGDKDAIDADGNIDPQGIDQSKLVPLLVKTIQELEARISALEGA